MHTLHEDWDHPAPHRDPFSRIAAGIATLLLYLPLFLLALSHPNLLVAPVAVPPRTLETIVRLLPTPRPRVPPQPEFIAHKIRLHAVNAPRPQVVIVPARTLAPPALLPVTAAELSPLAGGALPGLGNGAVSGTGTGGNGAGPAGCIDPAYLAAITRHIGSFFRYPAEAVRAHATGVVYVRFTVDKKGDPSALAVEVGSGRPVLDDYALALMRQAAPLPPIPDRMHIDRLTALFPIVFMLKGKPEPRIHPAGQTMACN
jgi:protein TonB